MSDRFDEDLLDEMAEEPEGKAGHSAFDEFEGADELEASDEFDESDEFDDSDEFEGPAEFEAGDEFDELEEPGDAFEAEEAAVEADRRAIVAQLRQIEFDRGGYIVPVRTSVVDIVSSKVQGVDAAANGYPLGSMSFGKMWMQQ